MAFGQVKDNSVEISFKKYIGVGKFSVVAVNPTKEEYKTLLNKEVNEEPVYVGTYKDQEGKEYPQLRLTFWLKNDLIEDVIPMSIFLVKQPMISQAKKCKVIDKYARTAWVTAEEFKNKQVPQYSNGPARISDYRQCCRGEEEVVTFIKKLLSIPNIDVYDNTLGKYVDNPNPEDCVCSFDNLDSLFKGDVSEIKSAIALAPNNTIKILLGVKVNEGKEYQDFYTKEFMSTYTQDYSGFTNRFIENKNNGAYPNTLFEVVELKEYSVSPSEIATPTQNQATTEDSPW